MASKRPVNSSNSVTGFEMTWATVTCGGRAGGRIGRRFVPSAGGQSGRYYGQD